VAILTPMMQLGAVYPADFDSLLTYAFRRFYGLEPVAAAPVDFTGINEAFRWTRDTKLVLDSEHNLFGLHDTIKIPRVHIAGTCLTGTSQFILARCYAQDLPAGSNFYDEGPKDVPFVPGSSQIVADIQRIGLGEYKITLVHPMIGNKYRMSDFTMVNAAPNLDSSQPPYSFTRLDELFAQTTTQFQIHVYGMVGVAIGLVDGAVFSFCLFED
jgi:hypothetical protein